MYDFGKSCGTVLWYKHHLPDILTGNVAGYVGQIYPTISGIVKGISELFDWTWDLQQPFKASESGPIG